MRFVILGACIGCFAPAVILLLRTPVIGYCHVSAEAKAISFIVVFQAMNSILTKEEATCSPVGNRSQTMEKIGKRHNRCYALQ